MEKINAYKAELLQQTNVELFLLNNSCLPGARANLELLYAFAEVSDIGFTLNLLDKYSGYAVNTPEEFVTCCAVTACGKHIVNGNNILLKRLRIFASDQRWRIREAVAMALQYIGKYNFEQLLVIAEDWSGGNYYEQRAVIAGLCEPSILNNDEIKHFTLNMLNQITRNAIQQEAKADNTQKTLIQALCYCWSVAIVASPEKGKEMFEKLIGIDNKNLRKIIRENLKKNRLIKMDKKWVEIIQTA